MIIFEPVYNKPVFKLFKQMRKLKFFLLPALLISTLSSQAQTNQKVPIDHSVYDSWKDVKAYRISNDGNWVSYEVNPQQGDGTLYIYNVKTGKKDSVPRAYGAEFSASGNYLVFKIKPPYAITRAAKMAKKKKDELPKDSLGIWKLSNGDLKKIEKVKSFKIPKEEGDWIAWHSEKVFPEKTKQKVSKKEQTEKEKKAEEKKEKERKEKIKKLKKAKGTDLVIYNPETKEEHRFENITDYSVSKNGKLFGMIEQVNDSLAHSRILIFNTSKNESKEIWSKDGISKKPAIDKEGKQLAFIHSEDTAKTKIYSLYLWNTKKEAAELIADTLNPAMTKNWSVSENGQVRFSDSGEKLFFSTAPNPVPEPKDTLLDDEKYHLDIWSWEDPYLQPMQKLNVKREQERSYLAVYIPKSNKMIQLATKEVPDVRTYLKGDADFAMGTSNLPYRKLISWDANWYQDIYKIDINTGDKKLIQQKAASSISLSPYGKFLLWYSISDSSWYARNLENGKNVSLTLDLPYPFYNELHDSPSNPRPYGTAGWVGKDKYVLIYDRFDIWKIDPSGKEKSINLTNEYGRKNNIRLRYVKLDREALSIDPKENILLNAFHLYTKQAGFFQKSVKAAGEPNLLVMEDASFYPPVKAKTADLLIWRKGSFQVYNDLWISNPDFKDAVKISNANPQQSKYLWGSVELVEWTSPDNEKLQGLLYKPENFDASKKYPMLVYFYERSSDGLNRYISPAPSRSIINRTYCVSNGYLIFVPDIPYKVGYPGQSAMDAVMSGTLAMVEKYPYIDRENIGLNGQSWGGYQIAYMVTQTSFFKCAFSGAPVSNMTSAYGGIRWASGMSRMFQYEQTQSRIGGTLWEKPFQYIENSPIFFVPKIKTPLLIMHNDADGAVPWYQGIEFFVALRRLNKPAWLLSYNNESHNLSRRADQKDLTIRMMQFYAHYLKGKPAPLWMVEGLPAVDKGKKDNYELWNDELHLP